MKEAIINNKDFKAKHPNLVCDDFNTVRHMIKDNRRIVIIKALFNVATEEELYGKVFFKLGHTRQEMRKTLTALDDSVRVLFNVNPRNLRQSEETDEVGMAGRSKQTEKLPSGVSAPKSKKTKSALFSKASPKIGVPSQKTRERIHDIRLRGKKLIGDALNGIEIRKQEDPKGVTLDEIKSKACSFYGVSEKEFESRSTMMSLLDARHSAAYIMFVLAEVEFYAIAKAVGGKSYNATVNSIYKFDERVQDDSIVKFKTRRLLANLLTISE